MHLILLINTYVDFQGRRLKLDKHVRVCRCLQTYGSIVVILLMSLHDLNDLKLTDHKKAPADK